jgi:hypothetical protein
MKKTILIATLMLFGGCWAGLPGIEEDAENPNLGEIQPHALPRLVDAGDKCLYGVGCHIICSPEMNACGCDFVCMEGP